MTVFKGKRSQGLLFLLSTLFFVLVFSTSALAVTAEIDQVRRAIRDKGARWLAAETSISKLPKEHRSLRVGTRKDYTEVPQTGALLKTVPSVKTLPANLNYVTYNYVTPVKDQGACGSCWAFASTAALESQVLMSTGSITDDAEQILVSCSGAGDCNGGYIDSAANFIQSNGLPLEATFPYTATNSQCSKAASPNWQSSTDEITGWAWVATTSPTVAALKNALYMYGPLVTTMEVYSDFFHYTGGVYSHVSGTLAGGHAVELVGFDDANQCFIVKNSWGTGWGEKGFFRIAYSQVNQTVQFGYWTIAYTGYKHATSTCSYSISPTAATGGIRGGYGAVYVTAQSGCAWAATSNVSWVSVYYGASGKGTGTVYFYVSKNTTGVKRTGYLTVAGKTFMVTQNPY